MFKNLFFGKYLEDGEKVIAVFHRHPFVLLPELATIAGLGVLMPLFLWYLFPEYWLVFVGWIVISAIRIFRAFMIYYHDAMLVTNVSLIDTFWHGFFDRSSTRLEYNMMEGVSTEIRGIRKMIFNYGTLYVQRGGGTNPLVLEDTMNPRKAERKIMEFQDRFMTHRSIKDSETLKQILSAMVQQHASDVGPENIKD